MLEWNLQIIGFSGEVFYEIAKDAMPVRILQIMSSAYLKAPQSASQLGEYYDWYPRSVTFGQWIWSTVYVQ